MENDAVAPPTRNRRLDTPAMSSAAPGVVVAEAEEEEEERDPTKRALVSSFKGSSSCSGPATEKTKRAEFDEYVTVTECLHFLDYSKKEHKSYWVSRREMARSREEYRDALDALRRSSSTSGQAASPSSSPSRDEGRCARGLEQKTPAGSRRRERNRLVGWRAVEREQYRQWDQGFKDPQSLADEYKLATQHCLRGAVQSAREDRQAVLRQRKYYEMDGLSLAIPAPHGGGDPSAEDPSSSSSASHSSTRFGGTTKHFATAAAGGLRPLRKQGRIGISRAA